MAKNDKIQVTAEMIEAGKRTLDRNPGWALDLARGLLFPEIYRAMRALEPDEDDLLRENPIAEECLC